MPGRLIIIGLLLLFVLSAVQVVRPLGAATATGQAFSLAAAGFFGIALVFVATEELRRRRKHAQLLVAQAGTGDNRRETYRIGYPEAGRPRFFPTAAAEASLEVLDLSEEGLRLAVPEGFDLGVDLAGRLDLPGTPPLDVAGRVVRRGEHDAAVHLTRPLPSPLIVAEQVRLKEHLRAMR